MKKSIILWLAASAVVMLAFPWLAVTFVKGDAGMAVCFLLFFAVNPLYSVIIGAFAGKDIRHLWSLPVISAVLFLIGTWIFFDMGETAFILYAAVYLVLGIAAMLISMLIRKMLNGVRVDEKSSIDFRNYFFGFNICRRWICSYKSWASKCGICGCAGNLDCDMFWVLSEWET